MGDTVSATYDDATLPDPYTIADSVPITATTLTDYTMSPLRGIHPPTLRIVDAFGNAPDTITVGSQVQIIGHLSNNQDRDRDFAYLVPDSRQ